EKFGLDISDKEKNEAIDLIIEKFPSPSSFGDKAGDKVYMINNYKTGNFGLGAAQRLSTSSTFTLTKGKYAKLSVWVKTANLNDGGTGANIKLVNTLNSVTQASYNIYDINTANVTDNNGWKLYTIFVKADDFATSTLKLSLGLGMGNGANNAQFYTEGTAFFDGVNFEELTKAEFETETAGKTQIDYKVVKYTDSNTTDALRIKSGNGDYYYYSLSTEDSILAHTSNYYKPLTIDVSGNDTFSSKDVNGEPITSKYILGENSNVTVKKDASSITLTDIKNAAYTLTIRSTDFKVAYESYFYLTFKVKNNLSKLDSSDGIKVYVHDVYGSEKDIITANSTTFEKGEDWTTCSIVLQNNFPNDAQYINEKEFYIVITIGPDIVDTSSNFANGESIIIKDFMFATGSKDSEAENYNFYKLFSTAITPVALINGEKVDYVADSDTEYYVLNVAPSDAGTITAYPAIPQEYTGVTSDHIYVSKTGNNPVSDDRSGNVSSNSRAGLINTKYLDEYENNGLTDIKSALGWKESQDNIQPLMIYNADKDSYGYIGATTLVSASTVDSSINCVTFEVSLKVVGNAKAFIYVVDLSSPDKDVMTIDVSTNTNGVKYVDETNIGEKRLAFEGITETNGWVTYKIYIVQGTEDKNIRIELWNGSRDGSDKSKGYVFFNGIQTAVSANQIYPNDYTDITGSNNPIAENYSSLTEKYLYKPVLTETEKEFNKKYPDSAVSHAANYIWAKSEKMIYAAYNLQDPIIVDPFDNINEDAETEDGEETTTNAGSFWLSLSSIILGVALLSAIIALVAKNVRRKRKANASDAKVHYNVRSRSSIVKKEKEKKQDFEAYVEEDEEDYVVEPEENVEETTQTLDEYIYSDVQDFGETEENISSDDSENN
ncbi:MAG: hypothetical protein J6Q32_00445, partial [Clostridia bacterium]|nr:hypothetical protein [Clostridia bacterium]